MLRRPPRSTRTDTLFPTRRSSDLTFAGAMNKVRDALISVVAEIAEKRGIKLVLFKNQIVIAEKSLDMRSEEHTSELQSLMRISYAVFCLKKKNKKKKNNYNTI